MKKIWRKNFAVQRVDCQMPYLVMELFYSTFDNLKFKRYIQEGIWIFEKLDNTGTYFIKSQLRDAVDAILNKVIANPKAVDSLHRNIVSTNKRYFVLAKKMEKLDYRKMSNKELISWYKRVMQLQAKAHAMALTTTWLVDSDGEDFSNYLLNYSASQIEKLGLNDSPAEVFSVLTTPLKDSMARIEEKELLNIVAKVQKCIVAKRILSDKNTQRIEKNFTRLPKDIQKLIMVHYKKWRWTLYTYLGPAYELDYYLELIAGLLRQKTKPRTLLKQYGVVHQKTRAEQKKLFKKLQMDNHTQHLFRMAQDIVFIKGFRKDCLFYGGYVRDLLLKEVAHRLHISLLQAKYIAPPEMPDALLKNKFSVDKLNQCMKFSVLHMQKGKNRILLGAKAKAFLKKQTFEKVKIGTIKELKGTPACPGKVQGKIRIINLPEEMGSMEKGDIMLAHTTYPALVPAMKKAAAIVTEDGGITCHAAIVSRELKIPCVVGIKIATRVLKDGDKVEVDAEKGIIKRI